MSWTYEVSQLATSSLFQTRFYCGDTNPLAPLVQDEEILFVLSTQPSPIAAAAVICDSLAARYAQEVDARVGDLSESSSQRSAAFRARAADLRQRAATLAKPVFGGLSKAKKESLDSDTDAVQPSFRIGGDDHPELPNERLETGWPWPNGWS